MSVNKVILVGNAGDDAKVRYLDNNVAVANFSVATTERGYTLNNGTQVPERTEWHNIVAWRGLAEIAEKYVKKGTQVYIEGKIQSRSYTDKDGIKRFAYEILADNMQLLGRKSDSAEAPAPSAPAKKAATKPAKAESAPFDAAPIAPAGQEDDLPF
ncbi:MAG: single-stranded DNA-binding protein [Paludibacteraceae bacterium]|nr:single-stranded DNA-binding protein [Paludibacteraceae bacterium]MBQ1851414.1 single-stranded DNA-binding protein [Paludibacteraceae bacterium]MBQ2065376.1 single-stranded DNA-binding protein [Paludibacteraceae bacterium]